jgi:hypothetical protein
MLGLALVPLPQCVETALASLRNSGWWIGAKPMKSGFGTFDVRVGQASFALPTFGSIPAVYKGRRTDD